MPGRVYYTMLNASVNAITDLYFIAAPTDSVVYIEEVLITQVAGETSEQLELFMFRTATDNSAQGTNPSINPEEVGDPPFGGVIRTIITGGALAAESTWIRREGQNVLNGWFWKGSYEEPLLILSPTVGTASRATIKLTAAPTAPLTFSGVLKIREIGG